MLCQSVSLAQTYDTSDVIKLRAEHAQRAYDKIGLSGRLLKQGKSYEYRYRSTQGHQFYKNENGVNSSITYRGIRFQNIDLQYDIYHDLVILDNWSPKLILDVAELAEFHIGKDRFVHLIDTTATGLVPGIYQMAFESKQVKLLIKRKKELIAPRVRSGGQKDKFVSKDIYYLLTSIGSTAIRSKNEFMRSLGQDPQIKSYIKQNRIRFGTDQDWTAGLVRVLEYQDRIKRNSE